MYMPAPPLLHCTWTSCSLLLVLLGVGSSQGGGKSIYQTRIDVKVLIKYRYWKETYWAYSVGEKEIQREQSSPPGEEEGLL